MKTSAHLSAVDTLVALGNRMKEFSPEEFLDLSSGISAGNPWFTFENIRLSWTSFLQWFTEPALTRWLQNYAFDTPVSPKKVGIVMAGNLPGVGFHDLICVLAAGHEAHVKTSSKDNYFITRLVALLAEVNPEWGSRIVFPHLLKGVDAVIATGSDNTVRHFDYYFADVPRLIRGNRSSCAVLSGFETEEQIRELGHDVFAHFGLGCRNVTLLLVPEGYDVTVLFPHWEQYSGITSHSKYLNNYEYYKSIFLVNRDEHLDTGFLLIRRRPELFSPVSVLHYDFYKDKNDLAEKLTAMTPKLQCVVSDVSGLPAVPVPFGRAQYPAVDEYADGMDTMRFLMCL